MYQAETAKWNTINEIERNQISRKWWDSLEHEEKGMYIKRMNPFNWGRPISVYTISKHQKRELFEQVYKLSDRKLRDMPLKYISHTYQPKGTLEGFPLAVIDKMLEYQKQHSGITDVKVFEKSKVASAPPFNSPDGFNWHTTLEGSDFWEKVIVFMKFDLFFEKYP